MKRKNKYIKSAHISESKFREVLRCFSSDLAASHTAEITGISRNSINKLFNKIRNRITSYNLDTTKLSGEIEIDESYFGAKRVRGKRGRGAAGKTPVFGLLKRNGKVYVQVVSNCSRKQLMPIIQGKVLEGSTIFTDSWKAYDGLIVNGYDHYRIFHSNNEFARGKSHINGIEAFWSFAKRRLSKFNGLTDHKFFLHIKECEFRFNNRHLNLYKVMLSFLRKYPL